MSRRRGARRSPDTDRHHPSNHLRIPHLNAVTQPEGWRPQEADEADRVGLGGGHERQAMGERPPRTGEESLDPGAASRPRLLGREGAASRPRRLDREGAALKRVNFVGKKEVAREQDQHRGAQGDPVHSLMIATTA